MIHLLLSFQQEVVSLAQEHSLGELLQVLLCCLLHQQLDLHGGVAVNHKNISLMYPVSTIMNVNIFIHKNVI